MLTTLDITIGIIEKRVNRSLPPYNRGHFWFSPCKFFFLIYPPIKYFCFDLPPNRPNKNENFLKNKIKLVFVWPIREGKSKQIFFTGGKSKKKLQGGKPEMTYISGG